MSKKCKHKPKNIFDKPLICKKCGKRLTHKIPFVSGFIVGTLVIMGSILRNYIFQDLITNRTTKFLISLVIVFVCEIDIYLIIGFREDI